MVVILDTAAGAVRRADSGYAFNLTKLQQQPAGVFEVDGYRAKGRASDHSVTRVYSVPWSAERAFWEWAMGYSFTDVVLVEGPGRTVQERTLAAAYIFEAFCPATVPMVLEGIAWSLSRVIPAQDPVRPWLFCSDYELSQGQGAWVNDPNNVLHDAAGNVVLQGGAPVPIPAIAYVDNSEGGGTAKRVQMESKTEIVGPGETYGDGRALVRLTFTPRPYEVRDDAQLGALGGLELRRYVVREEKYNIEALPLARLAATAGNQLAFIAKDDVPKALWNQPIPEAGIQCLPTSALRYTWVDVPDRPLVAYAGVVGKINDRNFDGYGGGSPTYLPGTLLCMPWETKRTVGPTGRVTWQIIFNFIFRPTRWNYFPTAFGGFYEASFGGGPNGSRVYQSANFDTLFQVPPPVKYV
jgi:hypothetical protein